MPLKFVRGKIRKILVHQINLNVIPYDNKTILDLRKICTIFADMVEHNVSYNNYSVEFLQAKVTVEKTNVKMENNNTSSINNPLTMWELTSAIEEMKSSSSSGPDSIPYKFRKRPSTYIVYLQSHLDIVYH